MVVAFRNETFEVPTATPADMDDLTTNERVVTPALLGSAARLPASAFATAAQGAKADTALQPGSFSMIDIRSFGAVGDGITDDTAAFIAAGATKNIVLVFDTAGGYKTIGTIPVNCWFLGVGNPTIHHTNDGGTERGFDLKSNSTLENLTISRGVTATAASGEFNNAFVVGNYHNPTGEWTYNVTVRNVTLIGVDGGDGQRSISGIYGNVSDSVFENITITGWVSYGIMSHWGGDFNGADPHTSTVTASWHPRRLTFRNIRMHSPQPSNALGVLYLSANHDILVDGLSSDGIRNPLTIASGDVGGVVAQGESVDRILQNIIVRNVDISNFEGTGIIISGASGLRSGTRWLGINEKMSIRLENITIKRGPLSTSGRMIDARLVANLTIDGYEFSHGVGADDTMLTPGLFIQACIDVKARGKSHVTVPWEVVGGHNIEINSHDVCKLTTYAGSPVGGRVTGQSGAHTLGAALAVNDTTITLTTLGFDIVPGSPIAVGGGFVIAKAGAIEQATPITIPIYPSPVSAANGAVATPRKLNKRITISGYAEGFYYGLHLVNTDGGYSENITVRGKHFYRSGIHDIFARGARNLNVIDSVFEECNQLSNTTGNNIRQIDSCVGTSISGCTFEDNLAGTTKAWHNVYVFGNSAGTIINGNRFHNAQTSAINYFAQTGTEMAASIGANWFGPLLPSGATGRISGTSTVQGASIGDRNFYVSTAAPAASIGQDGEVSFNKDPAAGEASYWQKRSGAWVSMGVIP